MSLLRLLPLLPPLRCPPALPSCLALPFLRRVHPFAPPSAPHAMPPLISASRHGHGLRTRDVSSGCTTGITAQDWGAAFLDKFMSVLDKYLLGEILPPLLYGAAAFTLLGVSIGTVLLFFTEGSLIIHFCQYFYAWLSSYSFTTRKFLLRLPVPFVLFCKQFWEELLESCSATVLLWDSWQQAHSERQCQFPSLWASLRVYLFLGYHAYVDEFLTPMWYLMVNPKNSHWRVRLNLFCEDLMIELHEFMKGLSLIRRRD